MLSRREGEGTLGMAWVAREMAGKTRGSITPPHCQLRSILPIGNKITRFLITLVKLNMKPYIATQFIDHVFPLPPSKSRIIEVAAQSWSGAQAHRNRSSRPAFRRNVSLSILNLVVSSDITIHSIIGLSEGATVCHVPDPYKYDAYKIITARPVSKRRLEWKAINPFWYTREVSFQRQ